MATEAIPSQKTSELVRGEVDARLYAPLDVVRTVFAPLASLKLTVVLLFLGILLVFFGTLAQDKLDMWEVMTYYFRSWVAWVELRVLLPDAWFPDKPALIDQPLFGRTFYLGFPFPGGLTIGTLMAANLLTAHALRFKIQSGGARLWLGLGATFVGVLLTWLVIVSGHNRQGLQDEPSIGWQNLWLCVKLALLVGWLVTIGWVVAKVLRAERRWIDVVLPGSVCAGVGACSIPLLVLGERAYLGDSSMRILWQLIQGGLAAAVLLAGCVLVFRKRGGIVLIHAGIALMMFNELFVSRYAVEERMRIREGETVNYVTDIRAVELAVVQPSAEAADRITVIPISANGRDSRFLKRQKIQHEDLPFDVEIVKYYKNSSDLRNLKPGESTPATAGVGRTMTVDQKRPIGGAEGGGGVNIAAGFVRFTKKSSGQDLGTYLVSQIMPLVDHAEQVTVDGKTFNVYLQFKRTYKPYSMRLIDVRKVDYLGTTTPKDYSSIIRFVDPTRDVSFEKRIWMNNPLRYAGETFYQSGYDNQDGVETTDLQVVTNTGWMIPYVGCMIVAVGMLAHFSIVLARFLNRLVSQGLTTAEVFQGELVENPASGSAKQSKKAKRREAEAAVPASVAGPVSRRVVPPVIGWGVPLALVAFFALWLLAKAMPQHTPDDQMKLEEFGRLPVVYQGRVKPYDSLARDSLRVISGRETCRDRKDEKQPAIRWLLDVISGAEDAERYPVFRIENLEVLQLLELEQRSGFRYSYDEFRSHMDSLRQQVQIARRTVQEDRAQLENYQRKLLELDDRIQLFFALRETHRMPQVNMDALDQVNYLTGMVSHREQMLTSPVPYSVPSNYPDLPWEPFSVVAMRVWVKDAAKRTDTSTPADLAKHLVDDVFADQHLDVLVEAELVSDLKRDIRMIHADVSDADLERLASQLLRQSPPQLRDDIERRRNSKRAEIEASQPDIVFRVQQAIETALGQAALGDPSSPAELGLVEILAAYREGDVAKFNQSMQEYRRALEADAPHDLNLPKTEFEAWHNAFAAFINCMFLYVVVFLLSVFAWLTWIVGWNRPLNRAALFLVLLTFLVHTGALLARIYISGRPPVTNLYSSAIFIGWASVVLGIVLEVIFRLGFGNVVSAIAGFSTMFVAWHLTGDGDTFAVLQAVLDTQFWLATHVVCITLGYAATFLAGKLAVLFIICGLVSPMLSWKVGQWTIGKVLATMIYGVICFAIFFSFVGTVLGGLWADDSWGRFWGWDPKENGALIIVLWNAIVLHARWDGLVKERGLALLAIGGNIVTAWSWFGVNQLGIGLHSYGFTEGVLLALTAYVASQFTVIGVGFLPGKYWLRSSPSEAVVKVKPSF